MEILIDELKGGIWTVALEKDALTSVELDPPFEQVRWGAIYWAKVARIDKARDAAFVNLDGDNIGLLNNADVRIQQKDGSYIRGGDVDIGKLLQPGQMIAVQAKTAYLSDEDELYAKAGQKSPKVSMDIVLHGRYTIYTPFEEENHLSRRITGKPMREALEAMLEELEGCHGCILRASAANTQTDVIVRETKLLSATWAQLKEYFEGDSPQLIMDGPDCVQRLLADNAAAAIEKIYVTAMDHYQMVETWCDLYAPDLVPKIEPVEGESVAYEFGLFETRGITFDIQSLFNSYVLMDMGCSIIIQNTAALVAIDVNSGVDTRSNLSVNHDCAVEIGRQIRLRNLGGIIMIDFLRMKNKKDRDAVKNALAKVIEDDPCTVQIHGWTGAGLLEVVRQRRTPTLFERFDFSSLENI